MVGSTAQRVHRLLGIHSTSMSESESSTTSRLGPRWSAASQGSQTFYQTHYPIAWSHLYCLKLSRHVIFPTSGSPSNSRPLPCSIYIYCSTRKTRFTATIRTMSSRPKDTSLRSNRSTQNPCRPSDGSSGELRTINVPHILLDLLSRNTQTWKGVSWGAYCLVETWSTPVFWQTEPRVSWNRLLGHPMGIVTSRRWRFS